METFEQLNENIRRMQADIRLEVILADLLMAGVSMDDVEFLNNSLFHRNYHRDIDQSSVEESVLTGRPKLRFVLNRQGLYDQLPEDLFHQPGQHAGKAEKAKTQEELRSQAKTETDSRRFFLPIEHEFYRQRIRLENEERKFLFDSTEKVPAEIFELLWDLPDFLDNEQKSRLGLLMPLLHSISGNIPLMESAMESVTGETVAIRQSPPEKTIVAERIVLGTAELGTTSVLGGTLSSLRTGYQVRVVLENAHALSGWYGESKKRVLFEYLCTLLMPLDADVLIEPILPPSDSFFLLDDARSECARLNFTTNL